MQQLKYNTFFFLFLCACTTSRKVIYESTDLKITRLTPKIYVHESYLQTEKWGKVGCNGMIYVNAGEAVIFDTPTNDSVALSLIKWVEEKAHAKVKALVVNHFHVDCLGGLAAFHQLGIPSYATTLTQQLAAKDGSIVPQNGFEQQLELRIGNETVINRHFGEGHTKDNIVSYVPSERTLFGGCLIKTLNAGKGNLADANVAAWSATVEKVKRAYPNVQHVIPGHGAAGDVKLLDFTMELFREK